LQFTVPFIILTNTYQIGGVMSLADKATAGEIVQAVPATPVLATFSGSEQAESLTARLTPAQQRALASVTGGSTIKSAAEGAGVSRATLYNWIERDPDFRAAYNAWQRELRESARARLLKAAEVAVETVARRVACDERLAMQLIQGLGLVRPGRGGPTDRDVVALQMRVKRKRQRRKITIQGLKEEMALTGMSRQQKQRLIEGYVYEQSRDEDKSRRALGAPAQSCAAEPGVQVEASAPAAAIQDAAGDYELQKLALDTLGAIGRADHDEPGTMPDLNATP
jgi:hypothetical protein